MDIDNILDLNNDKFEVQLMSLTEGKGCHIVVNTVRTEHLWATIRCVKWFGIIIQTNWQDINMHTKFGKNNTNEAKSLSYFIVYVLLK